MTQRDLDVLCGALIRLSMEELLSLEETDIWWLPDLKGLTQPQASPLDPTCPGSFRRVRDPYLPRCLAILRPRETTSTTIVVFVSSRHSATPAAPLTGRFILHERLETTLQYPGGHTKSAATESGGVIYACVMATRPADTQVEHDVICMCVQRSLPYLFVHAVTRCELRVSAALYCVLRKNPEEILEGHFDKLGFAFASAREHMAKVRALLMGNAPDDNTGPVVKISDESDQSSRRLE
ncbi:uncharacterized protein LOC125940406 isoform X2 [Dermacentor silvarum]|uniref:uncharacterized protein LOC125940406 isoform X2 n=1 Tax=Dermacentor silvarum TaxID=543639 RepID=UPI00210113F3|nr:uncharacterized protein LOC125940406 isoform X2 [Dermacentor silvarum]